MLCGRWGLKAKSRHKVVDFFESEEIRDSCGNSTKDICLGFCSKSRGELSPSSDRTHGQNEIKRAKHHALAINRPWQAR